MSKSKVSAAMGAREGDYIHLENQWARVIVSKQPSGSGRGWQHEVTGDIADLRASVKIFPTASQAMTYALESLAQYEQGASR